MNSITISNWLNKNGARAKSRGFCRNTMLLAAFAMSLLGLVNQAACAGNTTPPFHQAPPVGASPSAAVLFVIGSNGSLRVKYDPTIGPYENIEDTLCAVQNNSTKSIKSLPLSGSQRIFGFDGDGISTVTPHPAGAPFGPTDYEGPGTSFSNISADRKSGRVNFNPPIPPGGSRYFALEELIDTACPPVAAPPILKQGDTNWASNILGTSDKNYTIGQMGCYITSAAMMINFHAIKAGSAFRTDPAVLNQWLTTNNAYDSQGFVFPLGVPFGEYARASGVNLYYNGCIDHRDDFTLDQYLCNGQPPLLYVAQPHWVFCTGQTTVGAIDTYSVLDPDSYVPGDTLQGGFNNNYFALDLYSDIVGPLAGLYVAAHSPVQLLLTSPDGSATGFNPVGAQHPTDLPQSGYIELSIANDAHDGRGSLPKRKILSTVNPDTHTNYKLEVFGTGTGPFTLDFAGLDSAGRKTTQTVKGNARLGLEYIYNVDYKSVPDTNRPVVIVTFLGTKRYSTVSALLDAVTNAGKAGKINAKISLKLVQTLKAAAAAFDKGDTAGFNSGIKSFINQVTIATNKPVPQIPHSLAASLIESATELLP